MTISSRFSTSTQKFGVIPALQPDTLSAWSISRCKRIFDVAAVLLCSPILVPLLIVAALSICVCDGMPILFRQTRIGKDGRAFVILKFRTMRRSRCNFQRDAIASFSESDITRVGRILRLSKLDELPQIFNVLFGEMSLVGPRPRVLEQQVGKFACRPGITGKATLAFAREDTLLAHIPSDQLTQYYWTEILPVKERMDSEYMANASLLTDLKILLATATGRWERLAEPALTARVEVMDECIPLRIVSDN